MLTVDLIVEVAGCPTVCRHCWALGTRYAAMPLADAAWILESTHQWCDERGLRFGAFPMHEVAAHPQAADLIRLFAKHDWVEAPFQPLTTTGVPLALRDDWRAVLDAAIEAGTTVGWVAFHGMDSEHDRMVGRHGAFQETCVGVERMRTTGLQVGSNIFVTSRNASQIPELMTKLSALRVREESWEPAGFEPHHRLRRYEQIRVSPAELAPFAPEIQRRSLFYKEQWASLEQWTEGAWVRRALDGEWPTYPDDADERVRLVCRQTFDIHFGRAGLHGERFGNLRADGVDTTMERALVARGRSLDELWFDPKRMPSVGELALRSGKAEGTGLHFDGDSMRYLWLDRIRPELSVRAAGGRAR